MFSLALKQFSRIAIFIILLSSIYLHGVHGQAQQTLGTFKQSECITLKQTCANCSFVNVTSVLYPNSSQAIGQVAMTKSVTEYNATFCLTSALGQYTVNGKGDPDGILEIFVYDFYITESGENFDLSQTVTLLGMFAVIGLFFAVGQTFKKERWKIRTFFYMAALLMGAILLNSVRIMIGSSSGLAVMGRMALILGIVVLLGMFLFFMINYLIELFGYFKEKKRMKWEVNPSY